ncbi:MAG: hypothetical protein SGCHY_001956 [Lobulomycetales sp.]
MEPLSREILEKVQPDIVLSGDDHDVCVHTHKLPGMPSIPEYTLATFSMLQGNRNPGFATIGAPYRGPGRNVQALVRIHPLPPKLAVFNWYIYSFACTVAGALVSAMLTRARRRWIFFARVMVETVLGALAVYFFLILS